ncbi:pyridoxal 5'-phosphate synthase glutaminase subunit PdxT [Actinobacteria bacterium YIM 96077]|uniref:Pyridoxal 5'-phosphate synthase subunit PdxT n=1 Tax=Phytoactinopolyspora halophila TaxID=1981511 RepID=A0A329QEY9_9ACTN|nr:pyridoxal 5'-phosphate synthase glutaminase subunit PdxT [Phytoactinopolyspora halophila]AYY13471.1 pyridoxal 5'-phosphate synthase glutaminase subunit PdxT [Actinobacteria bacterium YIM 96077]RAW10864.1 pyridoxal 5'-phosphate synthase glutaminase subunit PdxT [Phytoactinopolyspora halophila]
MTTGPTIGVLALQGDVREHLAILETLGARGAPVRTSEELDGVDGLIIPGGESTTMWRLARSFGLLEPLRKHIHDGLPAYGSCAGMIMLADRLEEAAPGQETIGGLDITVRRNAFGRQVDSFEAELDFPVLGEPPMRAVFIRAPWVEGVGERVEVLARVAGRATGRGVAHAPDSEAVTGRIVAVRAGRLLATSFHPELTADARIHAHFLEIVKEA